MWKCSNDKVLCYHCDKYGHTKEKCFKFISYPTHWEYHGTCFKCNNTGHIARDCTQNDKNRKSEDE